MTQCTGTTKDGKSCRMPARGGTNPPRCFIHDLSPEELREHNRKAAQAPRKAPLKLPPLDSVENARKTLKLLCEATSKNRVGEGKARRIEAQVALFIKLHEIEVEDFEKLLQEHEAEMKRRYGGIP